MATMWIDPAQQYSLLIEDPNEEPHLVEEPSSPDAWYVTYDAFNEPEDPEYFDVPVEV